MQTVYLVTTNSQKFEEIATWGKQLAPDILFEQKKIEIPEYQGLDLYEISREKALHAWSVVKQPVLIDDGGIYLEQYHNFPGPLSKYVCQGIGLDGIWKLAENDPRASFKTCLVYVDAQGTPHTFEGVCGGRVIKPRHAVLNRTMPLTEIFIPEGSTLTYSELFERGEKTQFHHRYRALQKLVAWFNEQP